MAGKILVVEDETMTREGIVEYLDQKGYEVTFVEDGQEAITRFQQEPFDAVLLDVMLPSKNGFEVLKEIRQVSNVPVLMLTAMTDDQTQIMSFDERADDYIPKPFSLVVLEKRIASLLRRVHQQSTVEKSVWTHDKASVNFQAFTATCNQQAVDIKPKEVQLLKLLVEHPGQVLSREQILDSIWRDNETPLDRVVDVYIKNLRKKLHLTCIHTVKGIGYKYEELP